VCVICEGEKPISCVAALTTANRTDWAKVSDFPVFFASAHVELCRTLPTLLGGMVAHPSDTAAPSSIISAETLCSREGNRRFGIAMAMRYRPQWMGACEFSRDMDATMHISPSTKNMVFVTV